MITGTARNPTRDILPTRFQQPGISPKLLKKKVCICVIMSVPFSLGPPLCLKSSCPSASSKKWLKLSLRPVWWHMSGILALGSWGCRWEFKISLGGLVRPCLQTNKQGSGPTERSLASSQGFITEGHPTPTNNIQMILICEKWIGVLLPLVRFNSGVSMWDTHSHLKLPQGQWLLGSCLKDSKDGFGELREQGWCV